MMPALGKGALEFPSASDHLLKHDGEIVLGHLVAPGWRLQRRRKANAAKPERRETVQRLEQRLQPGRDSFEAPLPTAEGTQGIVYLADAVETHRHREAMLRQKRGIVG